MGYISFSFTGDPLPLMAYIRTAQIAALASLHLHLVDSHIRSVRVQYSQTNIFMNLQHYNQVERTVSVDANG